jgi:hypothetical protein
VRNIAINAAMLTVIVVVGFHFQGQGQQAHDALCVLRGSLQEQVDRSRDYLQKHPEGAPALHLSEAEIQRTISRQQETIDALDGLHCSASVVP